MSMNFHIAAERIITFKNGKGKRCKEKQTHFFNCVQTPTSVSYKLLEADDKIKAYTDYVISIGIVEQTPVYKDFFGDEIIGYTEYNWAKDHVIELTEWIKKMENDGYTIVFLVM